MQESTTDMVNHALPRTGRLQTNGNKLPNGLSPFLNRHGSNLLLLSIYALLVLIIAPFHEIWRDEARVLNYAREAHSVFELFRSLHNEGHPGLWHLLVYLSYFVFDTPLVLRAASLAIALIAVWIFLTKSPFVWWQKLLFILGVLPLYEYSVISRCYGLSMAIMFLVAANYHRRMERPVLLAWLLFLLAQTNLHAMIVVCGFAVSLTAEYLWLKFRCGQSRPTFPKLFWALLIIGCGVIFSAWQIYPDSTSAFARPNYDSGRLIWGAVDVLLVPGRTFPYVFWKQNVYLVSVVIWLFLLYCLRYPFAALMPAVTVFGLGMLFSLFFPGRLCHQGIFFLTIIIIFWWDQLPAGSIYCSGLWSEGRKVRWLKTVVFTLMLLTNVVGAARCIWLDVRFEYSSSRRFAEFIRQRPEYQGAVIISEPDVLVESVSYYLDNPVFIPREGRFGRRISWSKDNAESLSLARLLQAAQIVKMKIHCPVLIMLNQAHHRLREEEVATNVTGYDKRYIYTNTMLDEFAAQTVHVAEFRDALFENFSVFALK
jgi:hypothetical protein